MSIVKTENLSKAFEELKAIDNISFQIEPGEIIGLIGPDGAGKTTLLRLLTGLLRPTAGRIWVDGRDLDQNQRDTKDSIGYMPQHFSLYGDLSVAENMKFFADLYRVRRERFAERKKELLHFSGLAPFERRLARNLSGGMQKKLALSCNLFHTPKILFLDEPTTGVDPVSRQELWDFLFALNSQGVTLLVSTPYMDEAEKCRRVALIYDGQILAFAPPADLIKKQKDEVVEFHSDRKDARSVLKTMPGLKNIYPYAETLHLTFEAGQDGVALTKKFCREFNIPALRLKKIAPSFEDAFLGLISQK